MSSSTPKQLSDEDLVLDYLGGNPKAFDTLFLRYQKGVFFLVRQYFPQQEKAEEIFQEIFMKVLDRMERFDASGSFRAWLYTVCRNHCIDRLRYQARRPEFPESPLPESEEERISPLLNHQDEGPSVDQKFYDRQLASLLEEALQKLPPDQKETFILKERGGLTFEEIGQAMGVSINTVKSRMRYALIHLQRALKNKPFVKEALQ